MEHQECHISLKSEKNSSFNSIVHEYTTYKKNKIDAIGTLALK